MRGRKKLPRKLKIIRGTFKASREPEQEPEPTPVSVVPQPPRDLRPAGRALWRRLAGELIEQGILTVVDLPALELVCDTYAQYQEAKDAVYQTAKGKARTLRQYLRGKNSQTTPELAALREARATFRAYITEFGLTPASRGRLGVKGEPKKPEVDPMEALLAAD